MGENNLIALLGSCRKHCSSNNVRYALYYVGLEIGKTNDDSGDKKVTFSPSFRKIFCSEVI